MKNQDSQVVTQGQYLELSEHRNYLELTNLVCFYNAPNLNGLQLDYGETEEEQSATLARAQTLVNMPVYAFCTVNSKREPTFSGHEATRKMDGTMEFKTVPIGVHESVAIEQREVTLADGSRTEVLPCLVATQRIWKRNKNAVAAIHRLFDAGALHNSFEMEVSEYHFANGIRHALDYEFVGNAFLASDSINRGASVKPAYGSSSAVLSVAQVTEDDWNKCELMIAEALAMDELAEQNETEVTREMDKEENIQATEETAEVEQSEEQQEEQVETAEADKAAKVETAEETEVTEETAENAESAENADGIENTESAETAEAEETATEEPELSAMTMEDIYEQMEQKVRERCGEGWISFIFPEDHVVWFHRRRTLQTQYAQIVYEIVDDKINIVSVEDVKIVLPLNKMVAEYPAQQQTINDLTQQVAELTEYKTKWEESEAAKAKAEHDTQVAALRDMVVKSNCFTEDEIASGELAELIENLKTVEVKAAIFDKMQAVKTAKEVVEQSTETSEENEQPSTAETAAAAPEIAEVSPASPRRSLEDANDSGASEPRDMVGAMKRWLHR